MQNKTARRTRWLVPFTIALVTALGLGASFPVWWTRLSNTFDRTLKTPGITSSIGSTGDGHDHAIDAHDQSTHERSETVSLELTPQARKNLGLDAEFLRPVELTTYRRSITVPAIVVAKPGRSSIVVSSPLNGVVSHVHAVTGEAVMPGELLFEVRLTYEDLVETQTAYLKTISELEVENREIMRLEDATQSGAISGKQLLERRYAKEKLEAFAKSQREALRLHGLSDRQIDAIGRDGKLLGDLKIVAPDVDSHADDEELRLSRLSVKPISFISTEVTGSVDASEHSERPLVIDDLMIHKGQAIVAGEKLCTLSDYSQLFIEGKAFEHDAGAITEAVLNGWEVDAVLSSSADQEIVRHLKIAFVSNSIDSESRTLSFYVELPNAIVRDQTNHDNQRFISWKHRIGQRLEVRVPVEQWEQQIVLPVDAVVKEGADWFVFVQNGKNFSRVPVHVRHRDQTSVVVANDGSIFPGDVVAMRSAHQMQMAIKNQSGGGADPHAGHSH